MLDILTIVHSFADTQTASRIRRTCRRLGALIPQPVLYINLDYDNDYEYRVGGKLHRLDGPAYGRKSLSEGWYREGISHREYHPQYINRSYMRYMVKGVFHRETGPSIIYKDKSAWILRGKLHRKVGPTDSLYGVAWYTLNELHRLDGPIYSDVYAIRGVEHNISSPMNGFWKVDDTIIRIPMNFSAF